jgi:phenylpropionate dioxygenase-like ring-hydroxylating dioxygenase large terminal subunit
MATREIEEVEEEGFEVESDAPSPDAIRAFYRAMARIWQPVLVSSELTDEPVPVQLLGRRFVVARLEGVAVVFDDVCRHFGAALSRGDIIGDGTRLRCRYHGWTYDLTGRCVDIPGREGSAIPSGARVTTYATTERYGLVWVCLSGEPIFDIREFPEYDDDTYHKPPILKQEPVWKASVTRAVMAALDDSHFPWVHDKTCASIDRPTFPRRTDDSVWIEDDVLISDYEIEMPNNPEGGGGNVEDILDAEWQTVQYRNYATPNTCGLRLESPAGNYVLYNALQPIAYNRTQAYTLFARQYDFGPEHDERYAEFNRRIKEEDRHVVEGQRPWLLPPLSSHLSLYLRPADLPLIRYQQWMEELGIPQV